LVAHRLCICWNWSDDPTLPSGTERSGADAQRSLAEPSCKTDPHLEGEIAMSIGCDDGDVERVQEAVRETSGRVI
jgi:hypothetical protein